MLKHVAVLATILLATAPASAALIEFTGQTINEGPGPAPGGRCELPSLTFTMGPAAGPVTGTSNLGDFTPELSHCIILPPPAAFTDGLFDYEFGDGDVLSGTYVGSATLTATAGLLSVDQLFTITGGSGRFAGASGGLIGEGTIEFRPGLNPLGIVNFSGTINIVPEPAAFGLLGIGAGAIVFRRSRKSSRREVIVARLGEGVPLRREASAWRYTVPTAGSAVADIERSNVEPQAASGR